MQLLIKAFYVSRKMLIPSLNMAKLVNLLYDRECISDATFILMNDLLDSLNQSCDRQITDESLFARMLEIVDLLKASVNSFHARKQPQMTFEIDWKMAVRVAKDEVSSQLTGKLAAIEQVQSNLLMMIDYHMHSVNSIFYGGRYRTHLVNTLMAMDAIKFNLLKSYISCSSDLFNEAMQLFVVGVRQSPLTCNQMKRIILPLQVGTDQNQRKLGIR